MPFSRGRRTFLKETGLLLAAQYLPAIGLRTATAATGGYLLLVSENADRSAATQLGGASVAGNICVFVSPETGISRVRFYLDAAGGSLITVDTLAIRVDATTIRVSDSGALSSPSGTPVQTESYKPYDFAGTGAGNLARPFDTAQLGDGRHVISALIDLSSGATAQVDAPFQVANLASAPPALQFGSDTLALSAQADSSSGTLNVTLAASDGTATGYSLSSSANWLKFSRSGSVTPGQIGVWSDATGLAAGTYTATLSAVSNGYLAAQLKVTLEVTAASLYSLRVSTSPARDNARALGGSALSGNVYVFVSPESGVSRVGFYLDDPARSGTPIHTERIKPYDFAGTAPDSSAYPFNTGQLARGTHTITAAVEQTSGSLEVLSATFTVG